MRIIKKADAVVTLEGPEVCRDYLRIGEMWLGTSRLLPGQTGGLDAGHATSKEVFFVSQGTVVVENQDAKAFYELCAGDALLIDEGEPHQITNIGDEPALVVWCGAPNS